MNAQDLEQRARALLAAGWKRAGQRVIATLVLNGHSDESTRVAIRAIVAALRQQPAPVDLEQFREAVRAYGRHEVHDADSAAYHYRLLSIINNAGKVESAEPVAYIYQERYGHKDEAWIERIERALPVWEHRNVIPLYAAPHQPAPVVDDAAAALEAAREDARSGDWVLVPRELPRDALNYLAGFDMDSVGNSTGDAASECWGELVSMAANEVHELEFSNPVFHAGTNLTVRRGTKWYGREWAVVKVGEARVIVKLSTMTHKLSRLDDHWLRHEHDPACRTVAGIVAEMQRVYPGFDAYEDVTLVSFALPGPIAALARAQGVQS